MYASCMDRKMESHDAVPKDGEKVICVNQNGVVRKFIVPISALNSKSSASNLPPIADTSPVFPKSAGLKSASQVAASESKKRPAANNSSTSPKRAKKQNAPRDLDGALEAIHKIGEQLKQLKAAHASSIQNCGNPSVQKNYSAELDELTAKTTGVLKIVKAKQTMGAPINNQSNSQASRNNNAFSSSASSFGMTSLTQSPTLQGSYLLAEPSQSYGAHTKSTTSSAPHQFSPNQQIVAINRPNNNAPQSATGNKQILILSEGLCPINSNSAGVLNAVPAKSISSVAKNRLIVGQHPHVTSLHRPTTQPVVFASGLQAQAPQPLPPNHNQIIILAPDGTVSQVLPPGSGLIVPDSQLAPQKSTNPQMTQNRTLIIGNTNAVNYSKPQSSLVGSATLQAASSSNPAQLVIVPSSQPNNTDANQAAPKIQRSPLIVNNIDCINPLVGSCSNKLLGNAQSLCSAPTLTSSSLATSQSSSRVVLPIAPRTSQPLPALQTAIPLYQSPTASLGNRPVTSPIQTPPIQNAPIVLNEPETTRVNSDHSAMSDSDDVILVSSHLMSTPAAASSLRPSTLPDTDKQSNVVTAVPDSSATYVKDFEGTFKKVFGYTYLNNVRHAVVQGCNGFQAIPSPLPSESQSILHVACPNTPANGGNIATSDISTTPIPIMPATPDGTRAVSDATASMCSYRTLPNTLGKAQNMSPSPVTKKKHEQGHFTQLNSKTLCSNRSSLHKNSKSHGVKMKQLRVRRPRRDAAPRTRKRRAVVVLHNLNIAHAHTTFKVSELCDRFPSVLKCRGSSGLFEKVQLSNDSSSKITNRALYYGKLAHHMVDGLYMTQLGDEHRFRQSLYDDDTDIDGDCEKTPTRDPISAWESRVMRDEPSPTSSNSEDQTRVLLIDDALPVLESCHADESVKDNLDDSPPKLHEFCDGSDCSHCIDDKQGSHGVAQKHPPTGDMTI